MVAIIETEIEPISRWSALAETVVRAREGDREAFGELVEQFQPTVYSVCLRRLGNASDALELTQEVFLHVLRRLDQIREPERFAGWLRQVAARMAINHATRRTIHPGVETEVLEAASAETDDPVDEMIARERAARLWAGLGRLKELDRDTLVAFYIQEQSLLEMAERFDAPVGTIKRRLHVARKRLKDELISASDDPDEWNSLGFESHENEVEDAVLV